MKRPLVLSITVSKKGPFSFNLPLCSIKKKKWYQNYDHIAEFIFNSLAAKVTSNSKRKVSSLLFQSNFRIISYFWVPFQVAVTKDYPAYSLYIDYVNGSNFILAILATTLSLNEADKNAAFLTFIWYLTFVKLCLYFSLCKVLGLPAGMIKTSGYRSIFSLFTRQWGA